jgi:hypothetical protein
VSKAGDKLLRIGLHETSKKTVEHLGERAHCFVNLCNDWLDMGGAYVGVFSGLAARQPRCGGFLQPGQAASTNEGMPSTHFEGCDTARNELLPLALPSANIV